LELGVCLADDTRFFRGKNVYHEYGSQRYKALNGGNGGSRAGGSAERPWHSWINERYISQHASQPCDGQPPAVPLPTPQIRRGGLSCASKYSGTALSQSVDHMHRQGVWRVVFASLLKNSAPILGDWSAAVLSAIERVGRGNAFVSIVESGSGDATPAYLSALRAELCTRRVAHRILTSQAVRGASEHRIAYLARLRNLALRPVVELFSLSRVRFDKILFINDIIPCAGDMLRLLSLPASISCGYDFQKDIFYGTWASEFDEQLDSSQAHRACVLNGSRTDAPAPCAVDEERPIRVKCCWNGMAALSAEPFYRGIRFRTGMREMHGADCAQSECSLICLDFYKLGFTTTVIDPSVQLAYNEAARTRWWRLAARQGAAEVPRAGLVRRRRSWTWRCCEIVGKGDHFTSTSPAVCKHQVIQLPALRACQRDPATCLQYLPLRWEIDGARAGAQLPARAGPQAPAAGAQSPAASMVRQQCPSDGHWYACSDPRCNDRRKCNANAGLLQCACPPGHRPRGPARVDAAERWLCGRAPKCESEQLAAYEGRCDKYMAAACLRTPACLGLHRFKKRVLGMYCSMTSCSETRKAFGHCMRWRSGLDSLDKDDKLPKASGGGGGGGRSTDQLGDQLQLLPTTNRDHAYLLRSYLRESSAGACGAGLPIGKTSTGVLRVPQRLLFNGAVALLRNHSGLWRVAPSLVGAQALRAENALHTVELHPVPLGPPTSPLSALMRLRLSPLIGPRLPAPPKPLSSPTPATRPARNL
jgi:hypothetical protein